MCCGSAPTKQPTAPSPTRSGLSRRWPQCPERRTRYPSRLPGSQCWTPTIRQYTLPGSRILRRPAWRSASPPRLLRSIAGSIRPPALSTATARIPIKARQEARISFPSARTRKRAVRAPSIRTGCWSASWGYPERRRLARPQPRRFLAPRQQARSRGHGPRCRGRPSIS